MRAFVAVILPDAVREALAEVQAGLRLGRHVPEQNLHLTLAFLEDQPEEVLAELHEGLNAALLQAPELRVVGLDVFGGRSPKLLFAAVEPDPVLKALRDRVLSEARSAGIALKRERFRPHVTLARFRPGMGPEERGKLGEFLQEKGGVTLPPFRPAAFGLYGSTLRPEGATHELLAEYPLTPDIG